MNEALKLYYIKSYEGQAFRGSVLTIKFIKEKIIVGKLIKNLAFFFSFYLSSEKNVLFIIKIKTNNIDIDAEQISKFENEKEILFLPYSKFLVKKIEQKRFINKDIYEIEIEGLYNEHQRDNNQLY